MMNSVSIVIPVYNAENYLVRCLDSICAQTHVDFEVVLVNDGSSDGSGGICDRYAEGDCRIKVIHQKNKGVTEARKTGVLRSTYNWICFVDSDDFIPKDSLKNMVMNLAGDIDLVAGYMQGSRNNYKPLSCKVRGLKYCKDILVRKINSGVFARVIKKELLDDFAFDLPREYTNGEDLMMNLRIGQKCKKIIYIPQTVYYYQINENSANYISPFFRRKNYFSLHLRMFYNSILPDNRLNLLCPLAFYYLRSAFTFIVRRRKIN